nr:hypothetical protein CFP56_78754 [Quercus suber]
MTLTSCGSNIYHEISNSEGVLGLSMEKTKNEFKSGDLNLSLSVPNDSELLPYEVSNTVRSEEERSEEPKRHREANAEVDII